MGDRSWLGFGGRARTPQPAQQSLHPDGKIDDDRTMTIRAGESNTQRTLQRSNTEVSLQKNPHKAPRLSRFSSLMGLNGVAKAQSPTATSFELAPTCPETIRQRSEAMKIRAISYHEAAHDPSTGVWRKDPDPETEFRYRESDATWHNPSLEQMMESVQCSIMTNGITSPIPIQLNSFVAGMIEEFAIHVSEKKTLQKNFTKLEEIRMKEIQELRETTSEWQEREKGFKLEIKRLECIISDTQKGAESVVLARADSVCNRNDGRAFRAKLNRLSRSDEDEGHTNCNPTHGKHGAPAMRNAVAVQAQNESSSVSDHVANQAIATSEDNRSELSKRLMGAIPSSSSPETGNPSNDPQKPAVRRDTDAPKPSARNSNSTTTSSASGIASSASSGLLMGQGLPPSQIPQDYITPGTTPSRVSEAKAKVGTNHVKTLRELMLANGGLPENAIDDEDSYTSSIVPPQHKRTYSFDAGDDTAGAGNEVLVAPTTPQEVVGGARRSSTEDCQAPDIQSTTKRANIGASSKVALESRERTLQKGESCSSSPAHHSPTLLFMGRNHVGRAYSNPGDGRGAFIPGYSSPTRKAESGQNPFPSQETIQKARQIRTTHNTQTGGRAYLSEQELAISNREIHAREQARLNPTRAQLNATACVLATNVREN